LKNLVLEQKKEDLELSQVENTKIEDKNIFPQVKILAWPVPPATQPCQPPEVSFVAFCFPDKLPISLFLT